MLHITKHKLVDKTLTQVNELIDYVYENQGPLAERLKNGLTVLGTFEYCKPEEEDSIDYSTECVFDFYNNGAYVKVLLQTKYAYNMYNWYETGIDEEYTVRHRVILDIERSI